MRFILAVSALACLFMAQAAPSALKSTAPCKDGNGPTEPQCVCLYGDQNGEYFCPHERSLLEVRADGPSNIARDATPCKDGHGPTNPKCVCLYGTQDGQYFCPRERELVEVEPRADGPKCGTNYIPSGCKCTNYQTGTYVCPRDLESRQATCGGQRVPGGCRCEEGRVFCPTEKRQATCNGQRVPGGCLCTDGRVFCPTE